MKTNCKDKKTGMWNNREFDKTPASITGSDGSSYYSMWEFNKAVCPEVDYKTLTNGRWKQGQSKTFNGVVYTKDGGNVPHVEYKHYHVCKNCGAVYFDWTEDSENVGNVSYLNECVECNEDNIRERYGRWAMKGVIPTHELVRDYWMQVVNNFEDCESSIEEIESRELKDLVRVTVNYLYHEDNSTLGYQSGCDTVVLIPMSNEIASQMHSGDWDGLISAHAVNEVWKEPSVSKNEYLNLLDTVDSELVEYLEQSNVVRKYYGKLFKGSGCVVYACPIEDLSIVWHSRAKKGFDVVYDMLAVMYRDYDTDRSFENAKGWYYP